MDKKWFKFNEAMQYLDISRSSLYRLIWSEKLPGYKVGAQWRFKKEDLDNCIKWTPAEPPDCLMPTTTTDVVHQQI
jgi:excisionase family DNA binding protein